MIISFPDDGTGTLHHVVGLNGQTVHAYRDLAAAKRALEGDQRIVSVPMAPEPGCVLVPARLTREGDRVVFRMRSASYTIEEIETDSIGYIRHRTDDGARTCSYHPGELLWVNRNN